MIIAIDKKIKEGNKTKINNNECKNIGCENYELCRITVNKEKIFVIKKIIDNIDCPSGIKLQKAEIAEE
jgi:uncharacterized protein (UPF0179 family)